MKSPLIVVFKGGATSPCSCCYINDHEMALSIAKEKDTRRLDQALLERFAVKAALPKHMVVETALETAERTVHAWAEMTHDLPLQNHAREQIDEQLRQVPLSAQFLPGTPPSVPRNLPLKKRVPRPEGLTPNSYTS